MSITQKLTAIIEREGDGYVFLCPELDISSQGDSIEEARKNLQEALELFFQTAASQEIKTRLNGEWMSGQRSRRETRVGIGE
jgi:predicted RNase H-like HicB family nuclease